MGFPDFGWDFARARRRRAKKKRNSVRQAAEKSCCPYGFAVYIVIFCCAGNLKKEFRFFFIMLSWRAGEGNGLVVTYENKHEWPRAW